MRWISESEDISKTHFAVARLFEIGVLQENTKAFLHLLLEEHHPEERVELQLPPEEMHALLKEAFIDTYLFLLTPRAFIPDFLCFGNESMPIDKEMLARLTYFVDYPYFQEFLDEWLAIQHQSSSDGIRKQELRDLVADIDSSMLKFSSIDQIATYLEPLFELHHNANLIEKDTMLVLLSDKDLQFPDTSTATEFTAEDAARILKEAFLIPPVVVATIDLDPIPEYSTFLKELREIGVMLPAPNTVTTLVIDEVRTLPPLEMFIDSKLRNKCIEQIFRLNANEFERAITLLNSINEYSQAELNLRTLFHMHKVAPHSKLALRLGEALRLRFGGSSKLEVPTR